VTGKTVGGMPLYPEANRLDRVEALRRYTVGSAWFSGEQDNKGSIEVGKLADFAVLSGDYFSVPEEDIKRIESTLTVVGGSVVYGAGPFEKLAPPLPTTSPTWSPIKAYGGYHQTQAASSVQLLQCCESRSHDLLHRFAKGAQELLVGRDLWGLGCECFAF
jgi:hypothetical protein